MVKVLLENGADVNHPDFDGMTPLCLACMLGRKNIVQLLLQGKADVNHWDRHGRTPLLLASANGHHNVVKLLLEHLKGLSAYFNINCPSAYIFFYLQNIIDFNSDLLYM